MKLNDAENIVAKGEIAHFCHKEMSKFLCMCVVYALNPSEEKQERELTLGETGESCFRPKDLYVKMKVNVHFEAPSKFIFPFPF